MWPMFSLALKDKDNKTVRIYEVPVTRGIQSLFTPPVLAEIIFVTANGGKAVLKERKY